MVACEGVLAAEQSLARRVVILVANAHAMNPPEKRVECEGFWGMLASDRARDVFKPNECRKLHASRDDQRHDVMLKTTKLTARKETELISRQWSAQQSIK